MAGTTNTQFALAVHLLTMIGGCPDKALSSEVMSEAAGSNPAHVRRVLGELRRAGLVDSRPGPSGGWRLTRSPASISLDAVWGAVHGDQPLLGIHGVDPDCPVGREIHGSLSAIDREVVGAVRARLAERSVAQVMHPAPESTAAPGDAAPAAALGGGRRPVRLP